MSFRTQLRVSFVTLVTLLALALCVFSLRVAAEGKFNDAWERAYTIGQQVRHTVEQQLASRTQLEPPAEGADIRRYAQRLVAEDQALRSLLVKTIANPTAVKDILICDDADHILTASAPEADELYPTRLVDFQQWAARSVWRRTLELMAGDRPDFEHTVPIGIAGDPRPLLKIRVVVSSVLLWNELRPLVVSLAQVAGLSLPLSIVMAYLLSNALLGSLERLGRRIDSLSQGDTAGAAARPAKEIKEIAAMQSKLDVLSQQFRGAREDVSQLESNIARMLESLEEGVLLYGPDLNLLRSSRVAERLLGVTRENLTAAPLLEVFPEGTALGDLIRLSLAGGRPLREVPLARESGGGAARLLVSVEPLTDFPGAGQTGLLLTLRDLESRRQLRSQLDLSTRLAAISRLTGGVAHEIKNPLNAIALHLEILKARLAGADTGMRELEVISTEIARLDRVVKTFLDFTRPVELRLLDVDLVSLVRQVLVLVAPEAGRAGITIEQDLPDFPLSIRADEDLLKQAILNVVKNGIEAMSSGGMLTVRIRAEEADAVLAVADQGPGIPPEVREKVFNLYFTTKQKGSGIGLAMTFRIVQLHGGAVDFSSEMGAGTVFRLRFPVAEGALGRGAGTPAAAMASEGS